MQSSLRISLSLLIPRSVCGVAVIGVLLAAIFTSAAAAEPPTRGVWLGIQLVPVDGAKNQQMVRALRIGGPAHKAGLKTEDVVLAIDGEPASMKRLDQVLSKASIGNTIRFKVRRGDEELLLDAIVEPMPRSVRPPPRKNARKGWFGIGLEAASAEEQAVIGVARPVPRVTKVFKGSPAEMTGMQVGDYVVGFDGRDVASVADLVSRVGAKAPGTECGLVIVRGDKREERRVVLDLRPDMRELFKTEWLGRKMPTVDVANVRADKRIPLDAAATTGQVTVIDYFATWCGPCKVVMPHLERLQKAHDRDGLRVVGVSGEEVEVVRPFVEKRGLGYTVGVDDSGTFRRHLNVSVLPTIWVVDRKGVIRHIWFGAGHEAELEAAVKTLLAEPAP